MNMHYKNTLYNFLPLIFLLVTLALFSKVQAMMQSKLARKTSYTLLMKNNQLSSSPIPWSLLQKAEPPTKSDLECIESRQLEVKVSRIFAVEKDRCRYGHPRAFIRYPVTYPYGPRIDEKPRVSSGMLRLSCPHLVKVYNSLRF